MAESELIRNQLLEEIESSKEYAEMQNFIEGILWEQWEGIVYSGIVNDAYSLYAKIFGEPVLPEIFSKALRGKEEDTESTLKKVPIVPVTLNFVAGATQILGKPLKTKIFERKLHPKTVSKMLSISRYKQFPKVMNIFVTGVMNQAGQYELNNYLGENAGTFKLAREYYKQKITNRVNTLITTLDQTTKDNITRQLILGLDKKETKAQLIQRLQNKGVSLVKNRAKLIVETEVNAAAEYMRFETARLNGVTEKMWKTVADDRVCSICLSLDGQTISMKSNFMSIDEEDKKTTIGIHPPAHIRCRCFVDYNYKGNLCSNFVSFNKNSKLDRVLEQFTKEVGDLAYTDGKTNSSGTPCVNPNAVWRGGENLTGRDKKVGEFSNELKNSNLKTVDSDLVNAIDDYVRDNNQYYLETVSRLPKYSNAVTAIDKLKAIRVSGELSDEGYAQLLKSLGYTGKVAAINPELSMMTKELAEAAVKNSSFTKTLYHGTSSESYKKILDSKSMFISKNGLYGEGVYFSIDTDLVSRYGSSVVKAKINTNNIMTFKNSSDLSNYLYLEALKLGGEDAISMSFVEKMNFVFSKHKVDLIDIQSANYQVVTNPKKLILISE